MPVIEVTNGTSGARIAIPDPDLMERLTPSMVTHYQRRLGIKTPFAELPQADSSDREGKPSG